MITTITLTGADERTSIDDLVKLVSDDPRVEIGLLYTASPEGRNRYPSLEWLRKATDALNSRCAVHICGGTARKQLLGAELTELLATVGRIQVNGNMTAYEVVAAVIADLESPFLGQVITQHQAANAHLIAETTLYRHALLVDGSGGRGLSPESWVRPDTERQVGFAGGLGPENLSSELPKISVVATGNSWVDMEGRLRREDWFDIGLARECVAVFRDFNQLSVPAPGRRARP